MTEQEWRDSLKAGDEVYVSRRNGQDEIKTVAKTTATQIILDYRGYSERYRKANGEKVGNDRFYFSSVHRPTAEIKERVDIAALTTKARRLKDTLPIPTTREELEKFIEALRGLGAK